MKNIGENFYIGIIYVLIISIIMLLFELLMFILVISPQEKRSITFQLQQANVALKTQTKSQPQTIANVLSSIFSIITPINNQYQNISIQRENQFNEIINNNAIGLIALLLILFLFLIIACMTHISDYKKISGIVILAIITTIILMCFQLVMYHYGGGFKNSNGYKYPSDDEVIYSIMNYLKTNTKNLPLL